jgi:hypothetical protein
MSAWAKERASKFLERRSVDPYRKKQSASAGDLPLMGRLEFARMRVFLLRPYSSFSCGFSWSTAFNSAL